MGIEARWKHNKIFIHPNIRERKGASDFYVFVFEWGALDSNTISSVWAGVWFVELSMAVWRKLWQFVSLFCLSSFSLLIFFTYTKHAEELVLENLSAKALVNEFIIVWYMCCCCEIFTACSLNMFTFSVHARSVLSLSWNALLEF